MFDLTRRMFVGSAIACVACSDGSTAKPVERAAMPLRSAAPFPIGCALTSEDMDDPTLMALFKRNFSQVTPGYEMKMGLVAMRNGQFNHQRGDIIADYAGRNDMGLHGHTLVWYKSEPDAFKALSSSPAAFADLYKRYIVDMVTHYRGQARGWDVINEPVMHKGEGMRDSLWSRVLGPDDYMIDALAHAARAAPETPRFINDYGLEEAGKRRVFMDMIERLLKRGAALNGIGTQTHIKIDLAKGALTDTIRDLASFGLPIHVSELDISYGHGRIDTRSDADRQTLQAERAAELVHAYVRLPARQQYGMTLWGVRDKDSWLRHDPFPATGDAPLPFDDDGHAKPMLHAMLDAFRGVA